MAVFAVYIEKEEAYFGGVRRFGNTYHYQTDIGQEFTDATIAVQIADAEKKMTQAAVEFTGWRTWGPTDGPVIDNIIRDDGELGGTGLAFNNNAMYREACALIVWPLPRSPVLNRKRWLRKFIRLPGSQVSVMNDGPVGGYQEVPQTVRTDWLNDYAIDVLEVGASNTITLCTFSGVEPNAPPEVRPYLYTRQIGS